MSLREKWSHIKLQPKYILVSSDVVSLFTNVSVPLAIKVVRKRWKKLRNIFTGIDKQLFFEILEFSSSDSYFQFNNIVYSQIEGLAMGSPLSPIRAELVSNKLFDNIPNRFDEKIKLMTKYVDDSYFINMNRFLTKC